MARLSRHVHPSPPAQMTHPPCFPDCWLLRWLQSDCLQRKPGCLHGEWRTRRQPSAAMWGLPHDSPPTAPPLTVPLPSHVWLFGSSRVPGGGEHRAPDRLGAPGLGPGHAGPWSGCPGLACRVESQLPQGRVRAVAALSQGRAPSSRCPPGSNRSHLVGGRVSPNRGSAPGPHPQAPSTVRHLGLHLCRGGAAVVCVMKCCLSPSGKPKNVPRKAKCPLRAKSWWLGGAGVGPSLDPAARGCR